MRAIWPCSALRALACKVACLSHENKSSNLSWHSRRNCKYGSRADWPLEQRFQVRLPAHTYWFIACHKVFPISKKCQICACMVTQTCAEKGKRKWNGCVDIAIKALLMQLCSNNQRTWKECSQLLFFFPPSKPAALGTSSQNRSHILLLHLEPPVAFNGFKMPNLVELTKIHTKLFHPATSLHCNGV